jgi:hypothetical protein
MIFFCCLSPIFVIVSIWIQKITTIAQQSNLLINHPCIFSLDQGSGTNLGETTHHNCGTREFSR